MNPMDVPNTDWGLYYNHSYMLHKGMGLVEVHASHGRLSIRRPGRGSDFVYSNADALECLWPINRALNLNRGAVYVTRRPVRSARRSTTLEHYYIAWQEVETNHINVSPGIIRRMVYPPDYPSLDWAIETLNSKQNTSVAISRDIILCSNNVEDYTVICSGEKAGELVPDTIGFRFEATLSASPAAKRAAYKLQKEGFLCQ